MNQREQELDKLIIKIWELTGNLTYTSEGVSAFNFYGSSNKVRDAVEAFVNKTSKQDQLELLLDVKKLIDESNPQMVLPGIANGLISQIDLTEKILAKIDKLKEELK